MEWERVRLDGDGGGDAPEERDGAAADLERLFPNLFLIGAPRSGTSSLAAMLASNQEVFVPHVKEPGLFAADRGRRELMRLLSAYYRGGSCSAWRADCTTLYLIDPDAPRRLANWCSEVGVRPKFVVVLRNPVDRFLSAYEHDRSEGYRREDVNAYLARLCLAPGCEDEDESDPRTAHLTQGLYAKLLRRWLSWFPNSDMCVFTTEDLANTKYVADRVAEHLGVGSIGTGSVVERLNQSHVIRSSLLASTLKEGGVAKRVGRFVLSRDAQAWIGRLIRKVNSVPEKRDVTLTRHNRERLLEYYQASVSELESLLGRDLTSWKSYKNE